MCNFATLKFWCGHGEQKFLSSCDMIQCMPYYEEHDIPYPCGACSDPIPQSLVAFGILDGELGMQDEYVPLDSQQGDIFDFYDIPADHSHIDPQLIEQNDMDIAGVDDYDDQMLFPNWDFAENINAIASLNMQQSMGAYEPVADEEDAEGEADVAVVSEYPSPQNHAWNSRLGNEKNGQFGAQHMQMMSRYITPAPSSNSGIGVNEDYDDSTSPIAKRIVPKELSPTPGAREFDSYREAACETIDHPIPWLGISLQEFLDCSDDTENEMNSSSRSPISKPDFSRDCADLPDAESLGIERPYYSVELPIHEKKIQRGKLEAVLKHQDTKQEPKLRTPPLKRERSVSPALSSDSTISMYSRSSSSSPDRHNGFQLTMPKYSDRRMVPTNGLN